MTPTERLAHDGHLIDLLWARTLRRVTRTAEGCWRWNGAVTSRGYGCVGAGVKGENITAHRLAVLHRDGFIPEDMTVDHQCHDTQVCRWGVKCEHRRCVNPAHLKVMTRVENIQRKVPPPPPPTQYSPEQLAANRALLAMLLGMKVA